MVRWFVDRLPQRGIPSVSLRRLLPEAQFVGCADWEVSGCCDDHRRLDPGQVFVAVRGARPGYDGHAFVREALERGAAGVVVEHPCPDAGRLQVVVPDATAAHARICQALAGDPSHHLLTAGVTGSFGRTITALLVRSIFEAAGQRTGLLGALGFFDGTTTRPARGRAGRALAGRPAEVGRRPRPESGPRHGEIGPGPDPPGSAPRRVRAGAASLAALMSEMVDRGCKAGVLEASGEALAQRSFEGIAFHAAVATDVGGAPGLPRRGHPPTRGGPRPRLFRQIVPGGMAVVNADDPNAEILGGVNLDARRVAFAMEPASRPGLGVDVSARIVRLDGAGTRMVIHGFDRELSRRPAPRRPAGGGLRPGGGGPGLGPGDRPRRRRRRAGAGRARRRPSRGGRRGPGLRRPGRRRRHPGRPGGGPGRRPGRRRRAGALRPGAEGGGDRAERTPAGRGRRGGADRVILTTSNPRSEDPEPDPRPAPGRLPTAGQGPRRARPPPCHRGRAGRRPHRRLRADRRQGPPHLPDPRRSRRPLRRRRSRPRVAPPPRPSAEVPPSARREEKTRRRPPGRPLDRRIPRTKRAPRASV